MTRDYVSRRQQRIWTLLIIFLLGTMASGGLGQQAKLQSKLDTLLRNKDINPWQVSVLAVDLNSGQILMASRANRPLIPASNMKLVVTAAAVSRWGMAHDFTTLLARQGNDLVLIGSGDPGFGDPALQVTRDEDPTSVFRRWAGKVKQAGITKVGDIIVHDTVFDQQFIHPNWPKDQLNESYTAAVGGLNLWENMIWVRNMSRDSAGRLSLLVEPSVDYRPASKKVPAAYRQVMVSGGPKAGGNYAGGVQVGSGKTGSTPADPGIFFGSVFRAVLEAQSVNVGGAVLRRSVTDNKGQLAKDVVILDSNITKLSDIVFRANKLSRALSAECLIKALGHAESGRGSWSNGAKAVGRFLTERAGAKAGEFVIDDGSGLSRGNRLSPAVLVGVLRYMANRPDAKAFRDTLSISGSDGTLRNRLNNSALKGRVFAKTGYISQVYNLSGYIRNKQGHWIGFSILMNKVDKGPRARQLQQDICMLLVDS